MKKLLLLLTVFAGFSAISQNSPEPFAIEMEPLTIPNFPGIHSFSYGKTSDGKWVFFGGRIDGLHQRQPFAAFLEQDNNKNVFIVDVQANQTWSADLSALSAPLYEQLQSTNQNFIQRDTILYIIGGYGFSATSNDHVTYDKLIAVDLDNLADAVIASQPLDSYFRQITNNNLKVTGGQLGLIDSTFYLVGGQLFDGQYNPMGPNQGPGFTQEYTNEIRTFKIADDGVNLSIYDYMTTEDTVNLHRRDYNMTKQIFPDGTMGFTAWSGVFDVNDMPYLNSVDITPVGYTVNNSFSQYLSQYHSGKIPLYDSASQTMHTLFFGGMSQFYLDGNNNLVEDVEVPFVKTISKVTRFSDGSMQESALNYVEMPALLGSGAEFIPVGDYLIDHDMIDLNAIPDQKTLIGYIVGGIESTQENIFFINDGSQSSAYNGVFEIYINKSIAGIEQEVKGNEAYSDRIYPNPTKKEVTFDYELPEAGEVVIDIIDTNGKVVYPPQMENLDEGAYSSTIDVRDLAKGTYVLRLKKGDFYTHYKFVKK